MAGKWGKFIPGEREKQTLLNICSWEPKWTPQSVGQERWLLTSKASQTRRAGEECQPSPFRELGGHCQQSAGQVATESKHQRLAEQEERGDPEETDAPIYQGQPFDWLAWFKNEGSEQTRVQAQNQMFGDQWGFSRTGAHVLGNAKRLEDSPKIGATANHGRSFLLAKECELHLVVNRKHGILSCRVIQSYSKGSKHPPHPPTPPHPNLLPTSEHPGCLLTINKHRFSHTLDPLNLYSTGRPSTLYFLPISPW